MNPNLLRSLTIAVAAILPMLAHAQWAPNGRDAGFAMYLPQAKKPDTHAIFVVSYEKRWSCRPAISVLLMTGRKLGGAQKQVTSRKSEDQLSISVDGRMFTAETKVTIYSNGMELAMFAPPGFIESMNQQPHSVVARLGATGGSFDFSSGTGFSAANKVAASNCN